MSQIDDALPLSALSEIQSRVLDWYAVNRRKLPWRGANDPYAILVSEVMLQQTGVERVAAMYEHFLDAFPTFEALAAAERWQVLRAWAGLGYNRRAVHLHQSARIVVRDHGGKLPSDPTLLRRLPGLGPYTVAAILSFAFQYDVPALDTNVRRVIERLAFGRPVSDATLKATATRLVPAGRSADWNQALMDFGATHCTATNPRCPSCPLADLCAALESDRARAAPTAKKVAERPEPYRGSRRFYRGQIVARLRDLSPEISISADDLLRSLKADPTPADVHWIEELLNELAADGLAQVTRVNGELRVSLPR